jgi:hypothetical protein
MAFATANVRKSVFGDLKVTAGDWTGSAGDANGSVTVEGGRVYLSEFNSQDSNNGPTQFIETFISSTGSTTVTVSVANRNTVTIGRFVIIHA